MAEAFRETGAWKITRSYSPLRDGQNREKALSELSPTAPYPEIVRYAYRSFDRQWAFADSRLGDRLRPELWRAHSDHQVYLTTLLNHPLGEGPALTACAEIPDLHHFRGSFGAKEIVPLYLDSAASEANVASGVPFRHEDFVAYLYGILAHPGFTKKYTRELETRELRLPVTKDAVLFEKVRRVGARLLWLHTYGQRFVPRGRKAGAVPPGSAKCVKAVPSDSDRYPDSFDYNETTRTLRVGVGEFRPVAPEVYDFQVSGLRVVQSWLRYRMKKGGGKRSSPLDDIRPNRWSSQFTTELLEVLWVLEVTLRGYEEQEELLDAIASGPCFTAAEIPAQADVAKRTAPAREQAQMTLAALFESAGGPRR
jgi:Type ISP C-terminal specificity domain